MLLLAACSGPPPVSMAPASQDAAGKQFNPPPAGMAAVYFYNPTSNGPAINVTVADGDRQPGTDELDAGRACPRLARHELHHGKLGQSLVDHIGAGPDALHRYRDATRLAGLLDP
jgi:hypothetical protein